MAGSDKLYNAVALLLWYGMLACTPPPTNAWPSPGPPHLRRSDLSCVMWRQTLGCDPNGDREPSFDKSCDVEIEAGISGYCECAGGVKAMAKGCKPGSYSTCNDACADRPPPPIPAPTPGPTPPPISCDQLHTDCQSCDKSKLCQWCGKPADGSDPPGCYIKHSPYCRAFTEPGDCPTPAPPTPPPTPGSLPTPKHMPTPRRQPTPRPKPKPNPPPVPTPHKQPTAAIAGGVVSVMCALGLLLLVSRRKPLGADDDPLLAALKQEGEHENTHNRRGWNVSMNTVTFQQLCRATNNFDAAHRIGDGGSCTVYKAILYGCECAVKVLSSEADEWESKQFSAEVDVLTRVKHPNLVELYAYSADGRRKCLVLECMDSALDKRLLADDKPPLGWQQRTQIVVSVCRALVHLHSLTPKALIHRDVKTQNVLLLGFDGNELDDESVAKVADFGTVRVDTRNADGKLRTSMQTHASTARVVGTKPYMPNEYIRKGHVSEKTDSFAMGILVSESGEVRRVGPDAIVRFSYSQYAIPPFPLVTIDQIIELLISESFDPNDPNIYPHTFTYEARGLVDDFDGEQRAAEIEARSIKCTASSWASSGQAKHTAKALIRVAMKCTSGAARRSTPAEVLRELEAAACILSTS